MRRGVSLAETLVVCSVFLVLCGVLVATLTPGYAAWNRSQTHSALQENALIAMHRILREVAATDHRTLLVYPHQWTDATGRPQPCDALALLSPYGEGTPLQIGANGQIVWQQAVVFYLRTDRNELWSMHLQLQPPLTTIPASYLPVSVTAALQNGGALPLTVGRHTCVCREVMSLALGTDTFPLTVTVTTASTNSQCTLQSAASPLLDALNGSPQANP